MPYDSAFRDTKGISASFGQLTPRQKGMIHDLYAGIAAMEPFSSKAKSLAKVLDTWAEQEGLEEPELGAPWALGLRAVAWAMAAMKRLGGWAAAWAFGRKGLGQAAAQAAGKAPPAWIQKAKALAGLSATAALATAAAAGGTAGVKAVQGVAKGAESAGEALGLLVPLLLAGGLIYAVAK